MFKLTLFDDYAIINDDIYSEKIETKEVNHHFFGLFYCEILIVAFFC
jgi:hypothetical protein